VIPCIKQFNPDTYHDDQIQWVGDFLIFLSSHDNGSSSTIVDIGANRGSISDRIIEVQNKDDYDLICIEPHPVLFEDLKVKYHHNHNVRIFPYVMNDVIADGITFNYSMDFPATSHVLFSPNGVQATYTAISRQAQTLNALMSMFRHRCSFIKIDAEGHDFLILQGATDLLSTHRPVILFEFSGMLASKQYRYTPIEWYRFFRDLDYQLMSPIGGHDEKYILKNYARYCPDLIDILAIPKEKYHSFV
jgi:FkbM family methyltransferase